MRTQYQKLNVPIKDLQVFDSFNQSVPAEIHQALSFGETHYSLFFKATVPPLGYATFRIQPVNDSSTSYSVPFISSRINTPREWKTNKFYQVHVQ